MTELYPGWVLPRGNSTEIFTEILAEPPLKLGLTHLYLHENIHIQNSPVATANVTGDPTTTIQNIYIKIFKEKYNKKCQSKSIPTWVILRAVYEYENRYKDIVRILNKNN